MGTDRVNINVGDGEQIKPDGAYLNDLREARSAQALADAARTLRERAQGLAYNPSSGQYEVITPAASTTEREFTRTEVIGGREFTFTGPSQSALEASIEGAKAAAAEFEAAPARGDDGRFVSQNDEPTDAERQQELYERTQLEIEYKRGSLSTAEFLQKSHAIEDYLASQGVDLDTLREATQAVSAGAFENSWMEATEKFLQDSDWPGTARNQKIIQQYLVSMNLADEPSADSLRKAYEAMKRDGVLFPREDEVTQADALKATSTMSPEEMLALWKEHYAGGSADAANAALISAFRRK
jgi:hypothetical protein